MVAEYGLELKFAAIIDSCVAALLCCMLVAGYGRVGRIAA